MHRLSIHSFLLSALALACCLTARGQVVLENAALRLTLGEDGRVYSLICKATGEECLEGSLPLCAITQNRPYDNENFLMMPAKPVTFPSNRLEYRDGQLFVQFEDTYDIAVIDVTVREDYLGFRLARRDYRIEDMGVKRKTELDALALVQLPVVKRAHFGSWLNVTWDERTAVCLMGVDPKTRIDCFGNTFYAGLEQAVGMEGAGAVLIAAPTERFLDVVARVEEDYGLPKGVESRRRADYSDSYYELRDVTPENLDRHIAYARAGGFRAMVLYYPDFASTCGHYLWKPGFDRQTLADLCRRIREAGFRLGFHIHYSKVSVTDPYLCGGVPDKRLHYVKDLVLAAPLGAEDTEILLETSPEGLRTEPGRRLLLIGDEFIMYESFTQEKPYRLLGCQRGVYNTRPAAHEGGTLARQPDVDDWPLFIRINQDSSLPDEIAQRLAALYADCGCSFVYFDGAEDVPPPYWYNVSRSQKRVYDRLNPVPVYAEGALKSHYGWHILSRGNAFDLFRPEQIRAAMKKYTLRCARQMADDFTAVDFGWVDYVAPDSTTAGMQPDTYAYICSKALAWDAPISLMGKLGPLDSHPRTADNLRTVREWEQAKREGRLGEAEKALLRDPDREWVLLGGRLYESLACVTAGPVRAQLIEKDGRNCLLYWGLSGDGTISLPLRGHVRLSDRDGRRVRFARKDGRCLLPLGEVRLLETDMGAEELIDMVSLPDGREAEVPAYQAIRL